MCPILYARIRVVVECIRFQRVSLFQANTPIQNLADSFGKGLLIIGFKQ